MIGVEVEHLAEPAGCTHVSVTGEIDMWTIESLNEALRGLEAADSSGVVVDLGAVTFIDSTGIGALVGHARDLQAKGVRMAIVSSHPAVDRVLQITGIDGVIDVYPTLAEAIREVASRG